MKKRIISLLLCVSLGCIPVNVAAENDRVIALEKENEDLKQQVTSLENKLSVAQKFLKIIGRDNLVGSTTIPSGSMEPTVMKGDSISYDVSYYAFDNVERYDVVLFNLPDDESQLYLERVIGLPGETVEIRQGKVYIDGADEPLEDSFINGEPVGDFGPYEVPENSYFMLGDNRQNSKDSRYWNNKFVKFDLILGKMIEN
ncbi:MAG: signal peptidase I [Eubacteriales bacterium]|nr:signal peptidase I [Eubacteriales bacterium]